MSNTDPWGEEAIDWVAKYQNDHPPNAPNLPPKPTATVDSAGTIIIGDPANHSEIRIDRGWAEQHRTETYLLMRQHFNMSDTNEFMRLRKLQVGDEEAKKLMVLETGGYSKAGLKTLTKGQIYAWGFALGNVGGAAITDTVGGYLGETLADAYAGGTFGGSQQAAADVEAEKASGFLTYVGSVGGGATGGVVAGRVVRFALGSDAAIVSENGAETLVTSSNAAGTRVVQVGEAGAASSDAQWADYFEGEFSGYGSNTLGAAQEGKPAVLKGANIPKVRSTAEIGREAHRQLEAEGADEWLREQVIRLPDGTVVRKDGVAISDPSRVRIIKPDTPSGRAAAAKRVELMQSHGYETHVDFYDPADPRFQPGSPTYMGPGRK